MMTWTSEEFASRAADVGFDVCQITRVDEDWAAGERLKDFIDAGFHGEMSWLAETVERRQHPQAMWNEARSAIVLGMNYGPDVDPLATLGMTDRATISVYARNKDYHDLIKKKLKQLARAYAEDAGSEVKVFVDTAPLMEKPLAEKAGLGWQGKHTNLVSRSHGSWLFLGVILTDAQLIPDDPAEESCGTCRACLDICPTNAFPAPFKLDARRCISYLTIEHGGPIPNEFRKPMGNRIYGCDDCLAVCPWNKFAHEAREAKLQARPDLEAPRLADFLKMDDEAFRTFFTGSPIKRIKRRRFLRNVLIAVGNSSDPELLPLVEHLLDDAEPLIRGAATWALSQLSLERVRSLKHAFVGREIDPDVLAEWALIEDL